MALITGARLGPDEVLSAIGAGVMGEVYRARDARLDRAAIKKLPEAFAADAQRVARFQREPKVLASLIIRTSRPFRRPWNTPTRHTRSFRRLKPDYEDGG